MLSKGAVFCILIQLSIYKRKELLVPLPPKLPLLDLHEHLMTELKTFSHCCQSVFVGSKFEIKSDDYLVAPLQ